MKDRNIEIFPFSRTNAETLKSLGQKAVSAQTELVAFMREIGSGKLADDAALLLEMGAVETSMALDRLLETTFPELTPVDWGLPE